jgi:hypothetical protein
MKPERTTPAPEGAVQRLSDTDLAKLMLSWNDLNEAMAALEDKIGAEVMLRQKTFNVGDIAATYSAGRKVYDYEGTAQKAEVAPNVITLHSKTVIDWRAICKEQLQLADDELLVKSQSAPSVSVHKKG